MEQMRNIYKLFLHTAKALLLCFFAAVVLTMLGAPVEVMAEEGTSDTPVVETVETATKVKGLNHSYNRLASSSITDKITIQPGNKREVRVQYYNTSSKKWVTKSVYKTGSSSSAVLNIKYPNQWKKKSSTKWRIYIPASENAAAYTSGEIEIVTRNISSLKLSSKTAVIMRADDAKVIYGKKMHTSREMASTTKMMTAMVVLENDKLNEKVKISRNAVSSVTYPKFKKAVGSKFYVRDLLKALLIRSCNDSAVALAEYTGGSVKGFASMMNKKARELGLEDTHFANPHGLNNVNNYSSAYDLALIQRENITNEYKDIYLSILQQTSYKIKNTSGTKTLRENTTDRLLYMNIKGFMGGKTGVTTPAGNCFCGIYKYKGVTYIFTVLGSRTSNGRWNDCLKLMKYIRKYA